jgi:HAD superfamily hydrolase (TIGR01484 family)
MRFIAFACDYDETLARDGRVPLEGVSALEKLASTGRKLLLVTGRELADVCAAFPQIHLFDRVVAENGALIYRPKTGESKLIAPKVPERFVSALSARGVSPIYVGQVIVATREPNQELVLETIRDLGLELEVIFNKGAVMVLPIGISKASGLTRALQELGLSARHCVAIGDAENDHAFLRISGCAVAVANALPALKERADIVTQGEATAGVIELIQKLLTDDLRRFSGRLSRDKPDAEG